MTQNTYTMPAEWEKHAGIWLAWPYDAITFPNRVVKVERVYVEIINALYTSEKVNLLVTDLPMLERVENELQVNGIDTTKISLHIAPYADVWLRDYGAIFAKDNATGTGAWVKWQFNAHGNKFPDLLKDNLVFPYIQDSLSAPIVEVPVVMEGGSLEVNGVGTLITTEQCLLNPNRNPTLSKEQIEGYLNHYLGAKKIIWLKEGITNDHTDGHIDDFVKFVDANTILCGYEEDAHHPNFKILDEAFQTLTNSTDQNGNSFEVIKLPMPHMLYDNGDIAPVSYANFYIGNEVVLVPTYADQNDIKALEIIQSKFTNRKVVGIDCRDLIYGGGAIHCITQQEPKI